MVRIAAVEHSVGVGEHVVAAACAVVLSSKLVLEPETLPAMHLEHIVVGNTSSAVVGHRWSIM